MQQTFQMAAALSAMTGAAGARRARAALAGAEVRRHLINIVTAGGVDSMWWQNAVHSSEYAPLTRTDGGAIVNGSPGSQAFISPTNILAQFNNIDSIAHPGVTWDVRYPDSYLIEHPHQAGYQLGPGMSGFTSADLANTLIWRGLMPEGGHFVGNRIMQTGTTGNQTPSFPAIVAALTAKDYVRPLHYAQLAGSPADMFNQSGSLGGPSLPINIPDPDTWTKVTSNSDGLSAGRRDVLNRAVTALTSQVGAGSFKTQSSKGMYATFLDFFNGSVSVGESNFSNSAEFQAILLKYQTEINTAWQTHIFRTWFPNADPFRLALQIPTPNIYMADFNLLAFRFATAEFLVIKDLSSVVDVPTIHTDFHQMVDNECAVMLAIYTCYRVLVRSLKATEYPVGSGKSLLDCTTVVMHTEFDRNPLLSGDATSLNRGGTGHFDFSTSILMAGMGVRGGTVIGDFKRSSVGKYRDSDYPASKFIPYASLPINPDTGLPSPTGRLVTTRAIFPTILSIFNSGGLAALNGGETPLPAVMKS